MDTALHRFTPVALDVETYLALPPLTNDTLGRSVVLLDDADYEAWRAMKLDDPYGSVVVTDRHSGARLTVRTADCGGGCRCAASVLLAT